MVCKKCGATLSDSAKFCTVCGTKVEAVPVQEKTSSTFCMNCGATLNPDSHFCPVCGTPAGSVSPTKTPVEVEGMETPVGVSSAPKSDKSSLKMPNGNAAKIVLIAAIALIAVLLVSCVIGAVVSSSPTALIGKAISNTVSDFENNFCDGILSIASEGGAVTVSGNLADFNISSTDAEVEAALYFNAEKQSAAAQISISSDGDALLDIESYANSKEIVLKSSQLAKNAYGINLSKAAKELASSVFSPDSDSSYALPEDTYNELMELLDQADSAKSVDTAILKEYLTAAVKSVNKHGDINKETVKLEVGDDTVNTTAVTVSLTPAQLIEVLQDIYAKAEKDSDFKEAMLPLCDYYRAVGSYNYDSAEEMYDDIFEELGSYLEDLTDEVKDEDYGDTAIVMTFYVAKSGKTLAAFTASVLDEDGDENIAYELVLGKSIAETEEILFRYSAGSYVPMEIKIAIRENTSKEYKAKITVKEYDSTVSTLSFDWDRKAGDFTVNLNDLCKLTGTMTQKGNKTTVSLETVDAVYYSMDLPVTVTVEPGASVPSAPNYTDILTLKEDDMEALAEEVTGNITEMADSLYSIFGSLLYSLVY